LGLDIRDDGARIEIRSGGKVATDLQVDLLPGPQRVFAEPSPPLPLTPGEIASVPPAYETAAGAVPLGLDRSALGQMFPSLSRHLVPMQVATLLATTRVVGMECPGLNSLYYALTATWEADEGSAQAPAMLEWRTSVYNPELRVVQIEGRAPGSNLSIGALLRPEPVRQITAEEARDMMRAAPRGGGWEGAHALVIGGSRGLGEVASKLLAGAGAAVTLTYARGRADAQRVMDEIVAAGGQATTTAFDVSDHETPFPAGNFTHVFYFAAPRIEASAPGSFDPGLHARFTQVFVVGLARVADALGPDTALFNPSTVYLEQTEPGFAEYASAKAAAETLCAYVDARKSGPKVHSVRFPRLLTDQTITLIGTPPPKPEDALRDALEGFRQAIDA
jgi:NAD(P)-dependent dehydrogenase (short-subunit alcohol dehydrogenase family)